MTNLQITPAEKAEIIDVILTAERTLGTATKVADKCGVSPAVITQLKNDNYKTKGDDMWRKVGAALGWRQYNGFQTVQDLTNTRIVLQVLSDAQRESLFIPISEKAGAGKTTGIDIYMATNHTANVFRIQCRDWSKREFLVKLCSSLAIDITKGYRSLDSILEEIIHFFQLRKGKPLLIIDQSNSLKPSVHSMLIHLYNELKDKLGVVIAGTENMMVDIMRGVKYSRKGYDEVHSRFGRTFVRLVGYTLADVKKMCAANGILELDTQKDIFNSCRPITKEVNNSSIKVVEDGRLIERAIKRHLLILNEIQL